MPAIVAGLKRGIECRIRRDWEEFPKHDPPSFYGEDLPA